MTGFFEYIFIGSLWIYGFYAVFNSDHLLGQVADWVELKTSETFCRPLFGCPPCMASFHGGIIGLFVFGFSWSIIPYIICLCGLNFIIKNIIFND